MLFEYLYAIGFGGILFGLILWFYFKSDTFWSHKMRNLFFAGVFLYFLAVLFCPGGLPYKLLILCRDGLIIAVLAMFFNALKDKRMIFYTMLLLLISSMYFSFDYLTSTFETRESYRPSVPLDASGEILIDVREAKRDALMQFLDGQKIESRPAFQMRNSGSTDLDEYLVLDLSEKQITDIPNLKKRLQKEGLIDWFEPNEQVQLSPLPSTKESTSDFRTGSAPVNDPLYVRQWYLHDIGYPSFIEQAPQPSEKGVLAILDTGIDGEHEDLKENYLRSGNENDRDAVGHGTHCAGIAGAVTNNEIGIASLNKDGKYFDILSVKVLNDRGIGSQRSIIQGILSATDQGATVISLSLGGRSTHKRQKAYESAIEYASEYGAIVLAAAGNASTDADRYVPASVRGVICVSALDSNLNKASFSNHVKNIKWGIAAPGTNILSTVPGQGYEYFNGTSMATPLVSATVGIMKSIRPDLRPEDAWKLLDRYGTQTRDVEQTGRLIRIDRIMQSGFPELIE